MKQPSHIYFSGSSPGLHSRIIRKVLRTPEAQTTLRAITAGALGMDQESGIFFLTPRWFQCATFGKNPCFVFCVSFVCMPWVVIHLVFKSCPWKSARGCFKSMENWWEDTETSSVCVKAPSREDIFEFMETYGLPAMVGWNTTQQSKEQSSHTCTTVDKSERPYVQ